MICPHPPVAVASGGAGVGSLQGFDVERPHLQEGSHDPIFEATAPILAAAIYGGQPLGTLEAAGALVIAGDRGLAERFVTLFPLPPKAQNGPVQSE